MNARFVAVITTLGLLVAGPLRAETGDEWIAKARGYLGSDAALNAVETIHYVGTLESAGQGPATVEKGPPADSPDKYPVEIIFQKPYQQQMTVTRPASIDTMVLDGYDGWSRSTDRKNPKQWRITLLDSEQIKQLRANTWENLWFFSGIEKRGGRVELGSDVTIDGIACVKLSFFHSEQIVFHRYFDKATGRRVKTETSNGSEIREEGELVVDGVRFPRKIVNKAATGQVTTIVFDSVVLNERIPAALFTVPTLSSD